MDINKATAKLIRLKRLIKRLIWHGYRHLPEPMIERNSTLQVAFTNYIKLHYMWYFWTRIVYCPDTNNVITCSLVTSVKLVFQGIQIIDSSLYSPILSMLKFHDSLVFSFHYFIVTNCLQHAWLMWSNANQTKPESPLNLLRDYCNGTDCYCH